MPDEPTQLAKAKAAAVKAESADQVARSRRLIAESQELMRRADELSQVERFQQAARELGVDDEDEESFTAAVRQVAAHRPKKDAEPNEG